MQTPSRPGARNRDTFVPAVLAIAAVTGVLAIGGDHYLMFHTFIELFTAAVGLVVFSIAWHTRRVASSDYLTFIGMWAFATALVTILHALTYKGLQLLPEYNANLPTQLWLIARILQASAFVIAPVYFHRKLERPGIVMGAYFAVAGALVLAALGGVFPDAFVEGQGLTPFKVATEYVVVAATLVAAGAIFVNREHLARPVRVLLLFSMGCTIAAELLFTLYSDPFGLTNRVGHVAHLAAFLAIYLALVRTSLEKPLETMFHRLRQRELQLAEAYATEHDIAETLQDAIAFTPQEVSGLQISHRYLPAPGLGRIGGDFFDVFPLTGTLVGIVIGDVCGKGLKAASTTIKARTAIRAVAVEHEDPVKVLGIVNTYLHRELEDHSFVTAVYATIDTATGLLRAAIAGHPDPLVCGRTDIAPPHGIRTQPLGVLSQLGAGEWSVRLAEGESLVLVTDGVLDARQGAERFGGERLRAVLRDVACGDSAESVLTSVVSTLKTFAGERLDDDVAVMVVRYAPTVQPRTVSDALSA